MLQRALALVLSVAACSCATVSHGVSENIMLESTPSGASVALKCHEVTRTAVTPAVVSIPRSVTDCVATFTSAGYKPAQVAIERGPAGAYWTNLAGVAAVSLGFSDNSPVNMSGGTGLALLSAGTIGLITDAFNGAMFRHKPNVVRATLTRE